MITEEGVNPDSELRAELLADSDQPGTETAIEKADPVVASERAGAGVAAVSATRGTIHITFYEDPLA